MAKTKTYKVRFERLITFEVEIETTSQKAALDYAKDYWTECDAQVVEQGQPKNWHIKDKKKAGNWDKDQFKKYKGERGNADEWRKMAEDIKKQFTSIPEYLSILGLTDLPASLDDLKKARRKAMAKAHPDKGGSEAQAKAVNKAYDKVKDML